MSLLGKRDAVAVFVAFACAYFLSALMRAITATLAPSLTLAFTLHARDLGLLAGGYFLGFAATQLPLGTLLDRYGPKRVLLSFLAVAVLGCLAFSLAGSFRGLLAARVLSGVGLSACLMAPLTAYRRWFAPALQTRANAWMLMIGSSGMVASTLPVQWLLPLLGWRALFLVVAVLLLLSMALIAWRVPAWPTVAANPASGAVSGSSYGPVWANPYFRRMAPLGFFCYGGLLAVQTLWAAPWMEKMAGFTPLQAATGLFWINITMLCTFWTWGMAGPTLARRGLHADSLITWGMPSSFLVLALIIAAPAATAPAAGVLLALYCLCCSFVTTALPALGMAFTAELAGRALTAFNLVVFLGVFVIQWSIGLMIDALMSLGWAEPSAYRMAFGVFLAGGIAAYLHFIRGARHNPVTP